VIVPDRQADGQGTGVDLGRFQSSGVQLLAILEQFREGWL
jgi:hypothetical protein